MPRGLIPCALSLLVLGAHFLRIGNLPLVLALLACIALLLVRRPWVRVVVGTVLALGLLVWALTIYGIASVRIANGEPWMRMAAIMGGVFFVNLWALRLLRRPELAAWFRADPSRETGA